MLDVMTAKLDKMKSFWGRTNVTQRVFIGGTALTVIVAFFVMLFWLNRTTYKVLLTRLQQEDAAKIVQMLRTAKEPYQLADNGGTILVPEERVYDLRLKVAGETSLSGQGIGFEIFDEIKVGQTDFVQKINYQRALQGELQRTIIQFPEIERARVHLVIPSKSLFIEEQRDPTASIVLKMRDGKVLDNKQVEAVVNLAAMAIEGLSKSRITVADTSGKVLYNPSDKESVEGMTTNQLEQKLTMQQKIERRIEELLFPVIGVGKVIAKVNVDLDYNRRTIHKEEYDPEKTVVRSEQRSEESTQGRANTDSGVPEANFRGDGIKGALSQQQSSRETRTTNFEINKVEQDIVTQVGGIDRLSVAVIVDGLYEPDPNTKKLVFIPRKDEDMARIKQLVQSAVGFKSERGDQVEISSIAFGGPDLEDRPNLAQIVMEYASRFSKPILNALLIFLFLLLVVRPVIIALIRPRVEGGDVVESLEGLPEGQQRLALVESEEEEGEGLDAMRKIEDIKAEAVQMSDQNLDQAASVIKMWVREEMAKA